MQYQKKINKIHLKKQQTADRVARGAGSAFRVVAGTESLDSAIKNINVDAHGDTLDDDSSLSRSARSGNFSSVKLEFLCLVYLFYSSFFGTFLF